MPPVSGRSGAFEPGGVVACVSLIRGPRIQHHWPLTRWRTSRQDGPMREGVTRTTDRATAAPLSGGSCTTAPQTPAPTPVTTAVRLTGNVLVDSCITIPFL